MNRQIGSLLLGLFAAVGMVSITYGEASLADSYDFSPFFVGSANQPEMPQVSEMVMEGDDVVDGSAWGEASCCQEGCYNEGCCEETCCAKRGCCSTCCHCLGCSCYKWRAYGGALFWSRSDPGGGVLVEDAYGDTLLESGDYDFGWSNGWEAGVIRRVNRCWGVEGRFFRIDSFDAVHPSFYSPYGYSVQYYDPMTSQVPATITSSYHSELTNVELNLRRAITCRIDFVFGFRYLQLNDRYRIGTTAGSEITSQTENTIHAYNNLYGFHMGPDICLWSRGCFCVDWGARFGVYGNRIQTGVDIESTNVESTVTYSSRGEQDHTAFSADMTLAGTYCLNNCLSVRFGYQLLWLEGVAEASEQLASSEPSRTGSIAGVDTDGSPFYHGAFVDAVLTW